MCACALVQGGVRVLWGEFVEDTGMAEEGLPAMGCHERSTRHMMARETWPTWGGG